MGETMFVGILLLGAASIALWLSIRFPAITPETIGRITVHLGVSVLALVLVPLGTGIVIRFGEGLELRMLAIFAVAFPALVYALLVGVWVIRMAQAAFGSGR